MGKLISQRRARNRMQLHLQTCNWRLATSNWRLATEGNQNASSATNLTPRKREICGKRKNEARNKISSRSSAVSVQFSWCCCCWVSPHMASSFQLLVSTGYWLLTTGQWLLVACRMLHAANEHSVVASVIKICHKSRRAGHWTGFQVLPPTQRKWQIAVSLLAVEKELLLPVTVASRRWRSTNQHPYT